MVRYPISRLLLSVHSTTPTPTITAEAATTMVPEYSDVVIVFTCLLCALICVVGVMGVVRWTCLKRPLPSMSSTNDVEAPPSECFKKKIVESLPRLIFKSVDVADVKVSESVPTDPTLVSGEAECVICLSEFVDGEEIRMLPRCNHVFHVGCIDTWLIGSCSFCCPSCRQVLVVSQCHKCMADASVSPTPLSQPQPEADYLP